MKTLLNNWTWMRGIRLILGIAALVQGFLQKDLLFSIAGGLLMLTALADVGCCGSRGCAIDAKNSHELKEVEYEEVKDNK